ncbi:hypothetical protein C4J81_07700 [Deltaproteobacteria bacterium Smac51]|nr:hypothetical protein C4J81_07700 [Deltaproteobacteria bacterium Smac51]
MNEQQFALLMDELCLLRAAMVNNTVKQVEIQCVNRIGRELSAEEKDLIHRDCLQEMEEVAHMINNRCY